MLENESLGGETTDEVTGGTSDASETQDSGETAQAAAPKQEDTIDWAKAFDHPRFKELVEQKNQALASQQEMQRKLEALETRYQQSSQPQGPSKEQTEQQALIEELRGINPKFAAQFEALIKSNASVQQIQSRLEQFEKSQAETQRMSTIQAAVAKVNSLHESNKVSPEIKQLINDKIDLLFAQGKLDFKNIDGHYTKELGEYTKMLDAIKRSERESYVAAKKKDAGVPTSQPKGEPAKNTPKKPEFSKDPEVRRAQMVSRVLKQQAAEKAADSG